MVDLTEVSTQNNLLYFIAKYEAEFLELLLGKTLYESFKVGIAEEPMAQKWADLINGVEYTTTTGEVRTWRGLIDVIVINEELSVKLSPIANYVYYWYVRNLHQQMTTISVVKNKGENSVNVSPDEKLAKAWNDMVVWVRDCWEYIYHNNVTYDVLNWPVYYPGWVGYFPYSYYGWQSSLAKKRAAIGETINLNGL